MTEVAGAYQSWKGWTSSGFGSTAPWEQNYFDWHVGRAFGKAAGLKILEIGFGNGNFLGWARRGGHDATGIELDADLVATAQAAGFRAEAGLSTLLSGGELFDLIAAFDVLEHIDEDSLVAYLRDLSRLLRPEGRMIFRFPNGDSPFGRVHQHGDLTHVTTIGSYKFAQLCNIVGLQILASGDIPPWTARGPAHPLQGFWRQAGRSLVERFFASTYFGQRHSLTPNHLFVLGLRPK